MCYFMEKMKKKSEEFSKTMKREEFNEEFFETVMKIQKMIDDLLMKKKSDFALNVILQAMCGLLSSGYYALNQKVSPEQYCKEISIVVGKNMIRYIEAIQNKENQHE